MQSGRRLPWNFSSHEWLLLKKITTSIQFLQYLKVVKKAMFGKWKKNNHVDIVSFIFQLINFLSYLNSNSYGLVSAICQNDNFITRFYDKIKTLSYTWQTLINCLTKHCLQTFPKIWHKLNVHAKPIIYRINCYLHLKND